MRIDYCDFPDGLLYDLENYVWVKLGEEAAKIGITSVHAALAGKLKQVKFKPAGSTLHRGQSAATLESPRYFGNVRTPFSGEILEVNKALDSNPKLVNDFPYGAGWFVVVRPMRRDSELANLVKASEAEQSIRSQIKELHVRCFEAYPDYDMWEIGVECAAVLVRLNELMERMVLNEVVHVVSDDPTADIEMQRWSDETGQKVLESRKEGKLAHFIVRKVK